MGDDFEPESVVDPTAALLRRYQELQKAGQQATPEEIRAEAAKGRPVIGRADAFANKFAEGIPVLGPLAIKGDAAVLAGLESALGRTGGQSFGERYKRYVDERNDWLRQAEKDRPGWSTAGKVTGTMAGYSALPVSSMASLPAAMLTTGAVNAADTGVRSEATDPWQRAGEMGSAFVAGGAGGAVGYGIGKATELGAAALADRNALKAMGATTSAGRGEIKAFLKKSMPDLRPGDIAKLGREQGLIGGFKNLGITSEAAEQASKNVNPHIGAIIDSADKTGVMIPVEDALHAVANPPWPGTMPPSFKPAIKDAQEELTALAGDKGFLTHRQLQDFLAGHRAHANNISAALGKQNVVSESDLAKLAVYDAGRALQDAKVTEALPESGPLLAEFRRIKALDEIVKKVSWKRANVTESSHPIGLLGSMSGLSGLGLAAAGHPVLAAPLLLHTLGKVTQPYRANVLTSVFSGGVQPAAEAAQALGIPAVLASSLSGPAGAKKAKTFLEQQPQQDDFEPEPGSPATIAKRGR